MKPESFAATDPNSRTSLARLVSVALVLSVLLFTQPDAVPQEVGAQDPQYATSQYVQPTPNYIPNPQNKPTPYQYPQQPNSAQPNSGQQGYAQPEQYTDQQAYPQQQEQVQQQPEPQQAYPDQSRSGPYPGDPQAGYGQPQQAAQPFAADQLEQLVAPIALYPDGLVAQILAAATYPAQVVAADNWVRSQGYASPDQIANGASAQANWDPSIKALTAFPGVLDLMNHDLRWTTDLGNAYYNQPQDVLQSIQVLRQRAQAAGNLQSTPQEQVSYSQGYVQIAPVNPAVVYVPMYNPWYAYGQPISPYPGFSLFGALAAFANSGAVRFGMGMAMGAFLHTPFGWAGWALNWLASSIFFHQSPYSSHSTSVAHWGGYGTRNGNGLGGINRTPRGFPGPQRAYDRFGNRGAEPSFNRPGARTPENYQNNRGFENQNRAYVGENQNRAFAGGTSRSGMQNYAYNRPLAQQATAARQQAYARGGAYGYQRNDLAQRSYADPRSGFGSSFGSRGGVDSFRPTERSGGSHSFGSGHGGESFHASYHAPKAPKAPKMSGGGHHGGGGHSSHHGR